MPITPRPMTDPEDVERALLRLHGCGENKDYLAAWARQYGEALCLGFRTVHDPDGYDRDFA